MKHFPIKYNQTRSTQTRRDLRRNANTAEQILWKFIRGKQLGYKFRRQFEIHSFIVDFYCHELKLVIELDGWTHDFEKTHKRDRIKEYVLQQSGCTVIRITNEQVFSDVDALLNQLIAQCSLREKELCDIVK